MKAQVLITVSMLVSAFLISTSIIATGFWGKGRYEVVNVSDGRVQVLLDTSSGAVQVCAAAPRMKLKYKCFQSYAGVIVEADRIHLESLKSAYDDDIPEHLIPKNGIMKSVCRLLEVC